MMKPKWSGRVWVGVSKQPLSGARTFSAERSVDIEILSNLRFGSLEIRDTSVTRVTNNFQGPDRVLTTYFLNSPRKRTDYPDGKPAVHYHENYARVPRGIVELLEKKV